MIRHPSFAVEPWCLLETSLELSHLAQTESVFALSNGHIGLRANLDEGEPYGLPGTYLAGLYEKWPLPYAEAGFGYPEAGQRIVNVTNGKIIRLLVEDEPFDVRYGQLLSHQRRLDLRAGTLQRTVRWVSPTGASVAVSSTRLVSFTQRAAAAVLFQVEPIEGEMQVVVQSELVANESLPPREEDPRAGTGSESSLRSELSEASDARGLLVHRAQRSGLRVGAGMSHEIDGPPRTDVSAHSSADLARVTIAANVSPGRPLRVLKLLAYGWSEERSIAAIRDQVEAALAGARHSGWGGLLTEQREYLDDFWEHADVEVDGDPELQLAVRFALFHILQAGARGEQRAIAAKGLTGSGYDGHAFWDTEVYVLPVLTYTAPRAAADALRWRHRTLQPARRRARELGLAGACFPWRTIAGQECSSYWPAGTAAFHVNAGVANAAARYMHAVDDDSFEREAGAELLVETARLWSSLGHFDSKRRFRIDGVTGPDEYSALADNNVYTNLMAQQNLLEAGAVLQRNPQLAGALAVDGAEIAGWLEAAESMLIPFDRRLRVHPQAEGFTEHQPWDFAGTASDQYPLMLHFPYFQLYRRQVVKQADLVLAMHLRGDAFTAEEKDRNFTYYEAITVRDSSLSACTQAVIAAEVGHLQLAYDYLSESALLDLEDLEHNTRDGLHIAALAGTWIGVVAGFGGMRDHDGSLSFRPRLPDALARLAFRFTYRGSRLTVEVAPSTATYTMREGEALEVLHYGEPVTLSCAQQIVCEIPPLAPRKPPRQPPGRQPQRRSIGA